MNPTPEDPPIRAGGIYGLAAIKNLWTHDIYVSFERKDEYEETVTQEI